VERTARERGFEGEPLRLLREHGSLPVLEQLHADLIEIQNQVLPKSEAGQAVAYTLKNWTALTRYCQDPDLSIDNNATERALRCFAVGRANWTFFGSDRGGKTGGAEKLRHFLRVGESGSVRLVPRCAFAHRRLSYYQAGRTAAAPLGRGLLFAFIFGRLYPDEDLIPSMMFSRSRGTPTGKSAVQQIEIGNRVHQRPSPVRERLTAHTGDLISEKFDGTVVNAIIMRLNDSWLVLISKTN
jgi:hypothetical protein